MKNCFYCKRNISNAKKILIHGVKYVCKDETDVTECQKIQSNKTLLPVQYIEEEDKILVKCICSCGKPTITVNQYAIKMCWYCDNCGTEHTRLPNVGIQENSIQMCNVKCSCGHTFFTDFPIETEPPCAECPQCGKVIGK